MDLNKLIELCNKYTVEVAFNGFNIIKHKVIDAVLLLNEIHTTSDLSKEEFVKNISSENYMTPEYESIFINIKQQMFSLCGHESLNGHAYIERDKLNWLKDS